MSRVVSTLVLVLVLAGLVGYIYYLDRAEVDGDGGEQTFAGVSAEDIEELEITAQGETSRLRKTDGTWRLVEPVDASADENEVTSMTSSLASLDIQRVLDENATDLAQYGLDPARIEVAFRTSGEAEPRRIQFGERTPTGGNLYARRPGENRVFLVSSFLDSAFNKNAFALRDKRVLALDRDQVTALEIDAGARDVTLTKSGTEWRLASPIMARADFAAVEGALERLASAQMQGIVAADAAELEPGTLKRYGLEPPAATVTARGGDASWTLQFGETENALMYAKDASRPMVFTVAPTLYTDVIRDLGELRRKDLFDARSFTTDRIEFRRDGETIVLEKTGEEGSETWRTASGTEIDRTKAEDLVSNVSGLRAESFEATAHPALKTPALVVSVAFGEDQKEEVTFARAGTNVVATRADEPGSAVVDTAAFEDVLKALEEIQ